MTPGGVDIVVAVRFAGPVKAVAALSLLAVACLAGCGTTAADGRAGSSATGACPSVHDQPMPDDCVGYDPDAGMRANDAYRERSVLPPGGRGEAVEHHARIVAALTEAVAAGPLTVDDARAVLEPLGYDSVQGHGSSEVSMGGLSIGVDVGTGCVYGEIRDTEVTLDIGGGIVDGGCLPAVGN
ncbi:hypothetical protein [Jiangella alba]|uniref:Uncharacterized protein n=1 Tax=Jiangella alba TaxID=561176 RepID=A0A1H5Q041_9ACTN|nr:hypothetical protein [Jiangella alba]SEF18808.1 hypothetical protein SAMN04488561_6879 [Jiangella alba]